MFLGLTALTAVAALLIDWNAPDADLEHAGYELPLTGSRGGSRSDMREMATV